MKLKDTVRFFLEPPTSGPRATIVIRLMAGGVFFWEGLLKFAYANQGVGRFTKLVQEMSGQTQFIIITHSKKTMGIAPIMYGVTMQEPGVSKLVSVRFHEEPARMSA